MGLAEYKRKRNFKKTTEPVGKKANSQEPIFVVQKHQASHLHYDFRLEAFGVLKSWAVPKGPSLKAGSKRLAVEVEDHPIEYAHFEGIIPKGQYGGGKVEIWDSGTWRPLGDVKEGLKSGHLNFELFGRKLRGIWTLQRIRSSPSGKNQWLLIKKVSQKKMQRERQTLPGIVPKLALLQKEVPEGENWIFENKYDGYRTFAVKNGKAVHFFTRNNLDWSDKYPELVKELQNLGGNHQVVLDGEVVCLNREKKSSFGLLQEALSEGKTSGLKYYVFDFLFLDGEDLRNLPLSERRKRLKSFLDKNKSKRLLYSPSLKGDGKKLFASICDKGLEGLIAKDKTKNYQGGREPDWVKIKCSLRQEFVIGGYTDPRGSRTHFGALLMGVYDQGKLRYCGKVGTGFNSALLKETMQDLKKIGSERSPFEANSPEEKDVHWVHPQLVAEIEFRGLTEDQMIRQGSFQGLRKDKRPSEVHLEVVRDEEPLPLTHPERIIFRAEKISKKEVFDYYASVQRWMFPLIKSRPLALVRCTSQKTKKCFFQKHLSNVSVAGVREVSFQYKERSEKMMSLEEPNGILHLVQGGAVEFHVGGNRIDNPDRPDVVVFDLDPDQSVAWKQVQLAAKKMKKDLEILGLTCFLNVTGGKGLHIHVPIVPLYSWAEIKSFAKSFVDHFAEAQPDLYVIKSSKAVRKGKIFLDYLRNDFGATHVAPYSLRAKDKSSVAMPISWRELSSISDSDAFGLREALRVLSKRKVDPWENYSKKSSRIEVLDNLKMDRALPKEKVATHP